MTRTSFNIAAIIATVVLTASCTAGSDVMEFEATNAKEQTVVNTTDVFAGFATTRQQVAASSSLVSFKDGWTSEDVINIYNNEKNTSFTVLSEGEHVELAPLSGNDVELNGQVTATYPAVKFMGGQASFTLNGQNGTYENLSRYFLMTASANVCGSSLSLDFTKHVTVLKFNIDENLADGAYLTNATLRGNGICSQLDMKVNGAGLDITPAGSNELNVSLSRRGNDGYCYVAFYNTGEDFLLTVKDSEGGEHFINLNVNTLNGGCINEIPADKFEGGYAIQFGASVSDYNTSVYSI